MTTPDPTPTPAQVLELLAELREARTKKLGLVRNGKRDLALTSLINELDNRVMEIPAATLRAQAAALERVEQEQQAHERTIAARDRAQEAADRLAYALYGVEEIGEHTNLNCPWNNAAERLEAQAETRERWIPVGERLPDVDTEVLGWDGSARHVLTLQTFGTLDQSVSPYFFEDRYGVPVTPTHWQPLPTPPAQAPAQRRPERCNTKRGQVL